MTDGSFQRTLDHIRSIADSEARKGRLFERLMRTYFTADPLYRERFSEVWLWPEWAAEQPGFDGIGAVRRATNASWGNISLSEKRRLNR